MLTVSHLRKEYDTTIAVDDVSFDVTRGEIFGLLGPNGAGKTTTIRVVLDILQPDGGQVLYDGKPFTAEVRTRVGYLPEERGLYKKSRLLDTVVYLGELRGMPRTKARDAALRWLKRLEMADQAGRRLQEFSKGNQQKIQFIAAVMHDPDLVILDEPFSGLDPLNQELFQGILLELKQAGKAVIFSTHQMEQAERLSDDLCLINRGRVVLQGSVRDVKRRHGSNSLALEFEGDGAFLETLPGVRRARVSLNSAELQLKDLTGLRELLALINARVELRRFELREPSLQSIFLDVVGGAPARIQEAAASQEAAVAAKEAGA
jgi:ABC-2 type transport system ATP-binding protein